MKALFIYLLAKLGYQVKRIRHIKNIEYQLYTIIKNESPDVVLDIGANRGQFALQLIHNGWNSDIISFEPMSAEYKILSRRSRGYKNWRIWDRCAVGHTVGTQEINIANNSVSSSLRVMTDKHVSAAPSSRSERTELVDVVKLSNVLKQINFSSIALKIDVQGFEKEVLLGIEDSWEGITMLIVELSQHELYVGQWLEKEVIEFLDIRGFTLITRLPGFIDPQTGITLQYDGVFKRK